jgi:D-alanine-D-alanine ligase
MARYDCIVLYNAANISEVEGSQEKIYPSTILREEVGAIEGCLRDAGFGPYVLSVDHFSGDMVQTFVKLAPKFIFNLCEEINGNVELEMCVAGLLELMRIPYNGSRPAGIPVAKGYLHYPGKKPNRRSVRLPVIVKPAHEDASLGINSNSVCHDQAHLDKQVDYIHTVYKQPALVEEYLDGREFNVSIMGDNDPHVLAISEIDFSGMPEGEPNIVSYRAKWDEDCELFGCTMPVCPAPLSKRMERRVKDVALRSYKCIGCRDYARVDMRSDAKGNLYVLEVNPNPDISPKAGFARAARVSGLTYSEMILRISHAAMARGTKAATSIYAF